MAWSKTAQETTTYLDSGVVPVSGTAARSVVFRFKTSATYASNSYMWEWGTNSAGAIYRFRLDQADSYKARIEVNSGFSLGTVTSLNDGAWHGIAISNAASSDINATSFYIDGSSDALSSSGARAINTGTGANFVLGAVAATAANGIDCEYAEFAIYNRALDAAEMAMLSAGHITPRSIKRGRILYWPLIREYVDLDGLGAPSLNGTNYTISAHPRVIYPSAQILQFPPTAAGGGGPSVNINGSTVSWNGLTSYNWNGIA